MVDDTLRSVGRLAEVEIVDMAQQFWDSDKRSMITKAVEIGLATVLRCENLVFIGELHELLRLVGR